MDYWNARNAANLEQYRLVDLPGRVTLVTPVETDCPYPGCGWDAFNQAGVLADCPVCHGVGKVFTELKDELRAVVSWTTIRFEFVRPAPGVDLGDVTLGIRDYDRARVEAIQSSERAYFIVDGRTVRPSAINSSDIPGVLHGGYLVNCKLYTPTQP